MYIEVCVNAPSFILRVKDSLEHCLTPNSHYLIMLASADDFRATMSLVSPAEGIFNLGGSQYSRVFIDASICFHEAFVGHRCRAASLRPSEKHV